MDYYESEIRSINSFISGFNQYLDASRYLEFLAVFPDLSNKMRDLEERRHSRFICNWKDLNSVDGNDIVFDHPILETKKKLLQMQNFKALNSSYLLMIGELKNKIIAIKKGDAEIKSSKACKNLKKSVKYIFV